MIQRYEPPLQDRPREDSNGDYVLYEDHEDVVEVLQDRINELESQLESSMMGAC